MIQVQGSPPLHDGFSSTATTADRRHHHRHECSTSTEAEGGLSINPWSEGVRSAVYNSTTTRTDNKALEARVDIYCEDMNGNTFALSAAFTLMP
jgi:hypothetical protein